MHPVQTDILYYLIYADFKQLTRLVEHGVLDSEYVCIMLMIH